ncbi:MAG: hypothetical protein ACO1N9_05355 [Flavobacterium sp.]
MIRLFIDKLGDGHKDLFLKVDAMPRSIDIADSFYIQQFLGISNDAIEQSKLNSIGFLALKLIEFWMDRIGSIEKNEEKFIPFDLSDEYVSGLIVTKIKLGYKVKTAWTADIKGYDLNKESLDKILASPNFSFKDE